MVVPSIWQRIGVAARREPRREARAQFDIAARTTLLESDADDHEVQLESFRADVRSIKTMMMGVLVSATTASIIGALNLAFGTVG